MAVGVALAANTQTSALSTIFVTCLLNSPRLSSLLETNSHRLAVAYGALTGFFREQGIPYFPCNAGLYVFARLAPNASTWEDEAAVIQKLKEAGVLVSAGRAYHVPETEKGWARVGFALEPSVLEEAIRRMKTIFTSTMNGHA